MKKWFVKFPTYQYKEDVKKLAKENGLILTDSKFDDGTGATDVPKLTLKGARARKVQPPKEEQSLMDKVLN